MVLTVYAPNDIEDNTIDARRRHQPTFELDDGELALNTDFLSSTNFRRRTSSLARAYGRAKRTFRVFHLAGAGLRVYRNLTAPKPLVPAGNGPMFIDPDSTFAAPTEEAAIKGWELLERLVVELVSKTTYAPYGPRTSLIAFIRSSSRRAPVSSPMAR